MKKIILTFAAAMFAALSFVSCKESVDVSGEWKIVEVDGVAVVADEMPTINFAKGSYHAFTGINIVNGNYSVKGNTVTIKDGMMTKMAGPQDLMMLEDKIVETLTDHLTVAADGDTIVLSKDGAIRAILAR